MYKRALQTAKKRSSVYFSLAWRISHPGDPRRTSGTDPESRKEKQKSARISLNWPQAVLCFDYVEDQGQPETEVTLEEANEGKWNKRHEKSDILVIRKK